MSTTHASSTTTSNAPATSTLDTTPESAELTAAVDDLLNTLRSKFSNATTEMLAKMDEMSRRLDNLEAQLRTSEDEARRSREVEGGKEGV